MIADETGFIELSGGQVEFKRFGPPPDAACTPPVGTSTPILPPPCLP